MEPTAEEMLEGIKDEGGGDPAGQPPLEGDAQQPPAPTWNPKEWEFEVSGKKFAPETREQAMTWMSQGRNFSQRMAEYGQQRRAFEAERAKLEEKYEEKYKGYDRYKEIDDYARQNKDWWEHVSKAWETRGQFQPGAAGQGGQDFRAVVAPLEQKLAALEAWRAEALEQRQREEQERQDKALVEEIESIRTAHANIDFDSVDDSGKTLEQRVIDHAVQIGTNSFRAAFRDYCHDRLFESTKAGQLAAQARGPDAQAKAGIIGTSPTPRKPQGAPINPRGRSWDDIGELVKSEFLNS